MGPILATRCSFDALEAVAHGRSWLHALDPRAKTVATALFLLTVASFPRYAVVELLPLLGFPLFVIVVARVPLGALVKRLLLVAPLVLMLGAFNPFLDTTIRLRLCGIGISGGVLSYLSMILRFLLCAASVLLLVAVTGLNALCAGIERLGASRVFVTQVALTFRYLFVLTEEAGRMRLAASLRSPNGLRLKLREFGALAGQLLLRTLDRAVRVSRAMQLRGFEGQPIVTRPLRWRSTDTTFVCVCGLSFIGIRCSEATEQLGLWLLGAQ